MSQIRGFMEKRRRSIYVVTPLLLLIVCLGLINLVGEPITFVAAATPTMLQPSPTPLKTNAPAPTATVTPSPTMPVSPTPSSTPRFTPTPEETPVLYPGEEILLLGPPSGSSFGPGETVEVYWTWPLPLKEGERFTLYAIREDEEFVIGSLAGANLGNAFHLMLPLEQVAAAGGSIGWQVRLENETSSTPLLSSELRTIALPPIP